MDRLTRLIGALLFVGFLGWSVNYFQSALSDLGERTEAKEAAAQESTRESLTSDSLIDQQPDPKYLAFVPGIKSGNYQIEDLPGSDDRDYEVRDQTGSSFDDDDEDNDDDDNDDDDEEDGDDDEEEEDLEPEPYVDPALSLETTGTLKPGIYATAFDVKDCRYELHRVMKERREQRIGEDHLNAGRMIVVINEIEPDRFVATPECGDWGEWSPLAEPLKVAHNGDYWIGDLAKGPWTVPEGCLWEKVVGFRGAKLYDVQESGKGPQRLVINSQTLGIRIRSCAQPLIHDSLL